MDVRKLIKICEGKHVYIQTHNFPDPDAIASAYGLQKLFENFGIASTIIYVGKIDKLSTTKMVETFGIELFSHDSIAKDLRDDDYIICVDSQKNAGNILDVTGEEIAAIDHHPTFVQVDYRYFDQRIVGACATIITGYYRDLGIEPDTNTATALLYGIKMDTLQFVRGVTAEDITAYEFLFKYIDDETLLRLEGNNMEYKDLQAYGAAIENVKLYGVAGFSKVDFACPDALIAILSDFILSLVEVEVAIVYSEREDGVKLSIRSEKAEVNAGEIARKALEGIGSGGGHAAMAGGFISKEAYMNLGNFRDDVIRDRFVEAMGDNI
ncbi:MAG: DHH family phosphoesterase [Lachnospiraceae bacterium]|nr:DHH family phosphoesterase [Lachnospiraceae bacterium]MBQ6089911.1 DHH family phosphoesterase [Lachnospiraceae bacterium]MBR5368253.1 DHH family phosphoesterase [Lachnospiraceae bacterium]